MKITYLLVMEQKQTLKLLLDYEEAAAALSLSRAALRDLVYKGRGPVVTKIGRRTFFAVRDLEDFVEQHRQPQSVRLPDDGLPAKKRKRGRPTKAEQVAHDALFSR